MTHRVWGVDFSGAAYPGDRLALAEATVTDAVVHIDAVDAVASRCGAGEARADAIAGLVDLAEELRPTRVGVDAALSLPQAATRALGVDHWKALPGAVRHRCPDVQALTALVIDAAPSTGPRYPRRVTDVRASALPPVHFMIAAQTHAALTELLPRWQHIGAVAPHLDGHPHLREVYPAAALNLWGLAAAGYKGDDATHRDRRLTILDALTRTGVVTTTASVRDAMLAQPGGDLLDAGIAAVVTALTPTTSPPGPPIEGVICGADPTDYPSGCPLLDL
jgi:Protein of unknown function (DUF429).